MIKIQKLNTEIKQQNIEWNKKIFHNKNVFDEARRIFYREFSLRQKSIPVINKNGKLLYLLKWDTNQVESYCHVKEFWEYDIFHKSIDYELLDRGEVYIFTTFEEYTYQIARIIQRKYPQKKIFFVDQNARLFFDDTEFLHIIYSIADIYNKYKIYISKTIFTIDSKKKFSLNSMCFITKCYSSLSIMTSLFWECDMIFYGNKNPDKIFYVIKDQLGGSGLVDMKKRALVKIEMVKKKPGNIIPIVDFSVKGDINQFTGGGWRKCMDYVF